MWLIPLIAVLIWWYMSKSDERLKEKVLKLAAPYKDMIVQEAINHGVPGWIMLRIAYIESTFNPRAVNQDGSWGMFQISQGVLDDYNFWHMLGTQYMQADLFDPAIAAKVASWQMARLLHQCDHVIQCAVRSYNGGYGNRDKPSTAPYWRKFNQAALFFPEVGY